ncbi:hypothetical protein [Kocuria salina]|uniref:hypothetical protein n=1 Tax=Kocuria salina TaxID=1929416 RepID=UPI001593B6B4|nr:hypothetical protein [Kocuria salina]
MTSPVDLWPYGCICEFKFNQELDGEFYNVLSLIEPDCPHRHRHPLLEEKP